MAMGRREELDSGAVREKDEDVALLTLHTQPHYIHVRTRTRTHTHMHTHARMHMRTHTHTRTPPYRPAVRPAPPAVCSEEASQLE